ncbi:MAG: protein kinase domain-containing protein [Acidobacteriota bacterium]
MVALGAVMSNSRRQNLPDPYHLVGTVIHNKYRLDAVLGIGGMGIVYLAQHLGINRSLALKILKPDVAAADPTIAEAFHREAKISGSLSHPNIISVTDADTLPDGTPFMAMELLESPTLEDELQQRKTLPLDRVERLLSQICDALHYAHRSGLVHRDLKPANIALIEAGKLAEQVKILDFGIAKSLDEGVGKVSQAIGTPLYASPEQFIHGGDIDARADLYSLAVILYRMLTGVLPFQGKTIGEIVSLHLTAPPPPLRTHAPELPEALEAFVIGALAKKPDGRPATALDFLAGFRAARQGTVVGEVSAPLLGSGTDLIVGVLDTPSPTAPSTTPPDAAEATGNITTSRVSPTRPSGLSPTLPSAGTPGPPPDSRTLTLNQTAHRDLPPTVAPSQATASSTRLGIPVWAVAVAALFAIGLLLMVGIYITRSSAAGSASETSGATGEASPSQTTKSPSAASDALRSRFDQVSRQVYQAVEPLVPDGQEDPLLRELRQVLTLNPATIASHRQKIEAAENQVAQAAEKWLNAVVPDTCAAEYRALGERYQQLRDALHNYGVSVRNLGNAFARTDFDMSQPRERFAESERQELGRDRSILESAWRDVRRADGRFRDCTGL